jgi:hypothetical protein
MTLNATPQAPQQPQGQWGYNNDMLNAMGRNLAMGQRGGMGAGDIVDMRAQNNALYGMQQPYGGPVLQSSGPNAAQGPGATGGPAAAPQGSGQPNNWQAALSALANPGNPVTPGATVPQMTGSQPAGGVNQAFLSQAGPGMNQNFLSALAAIQGRGGQGGQAAPTGGGALAAPPTPPSPSPSPSPSPNGVLGGNMLSGPMAAPPPGVSPGGGIGPGSLPAPPTPASALPTVRPDGTIDPNDPKFWALYSGQGTNTPAGANPFAGYAAAQRNLAGR